jgi:hypothetical protein
MFEFALATGEDSAYWDAVCALLSDQGLVTGDWESDATRLVMDQWRDGCPPDGYDPNAAMAQIMTALKSFDRYVRLSEGSE